MSIRTILAVRRASTALVGITCAIGLFALASPASAAPVCVANAKAKIKISGPLVVPVPEEEVADYEAKGFARVACSRADATPAVIRDRLCALNAQLPPALGEKLAANLGASPAQLCVSATKAVGGTAQ